MEDSGTRNLLTAFIDLSPGTVSTMASTIRVVACVVVEVVRSWIRQTENRLEVDLYILPPLDTVLRRPRSLRTQHDTCWKVPPSSLRLNFSAPQFVVLHSLNFVHTYPPCQIPTHPTKHPSSFVRYVSDSFIPSLTNSLLIRG